MAPLILELSSLEAESLDVVTRTTQQEESLDTLTTMEGDVVAVLTGNGILPVNSAYQNCAHGGGAACCCCCCPVCAACC